VLYNYIISHEFAILQSKQGLYKLTYTENNVFYYFIL